MITTHSEHITPYPRPDYTDGLLLSKELSNGSFIQALINDIRAGRPPLSRYSVGLDELLLIAAENHKYSYEYTSLDMQKYDIAKLKEIAWLPYYTGEDKRKIDEVYNPKRFYEEVTYDDIDITYTIGSGANEYCRLNIPYYDSGNAGLYGVSTDKDNDKISKSVWFYSLKDNSFTRLGSIPNDLQDKNVTPIVYVKGAVILRFEVDYDAQVYSYVAYGFDGTINRIDNQNGGEIPLADFGRIVIRSNELAGEKHRCYAYDAFLRKTGEYYDDDVVGNGVFQLISFSRYGFGNRLGSSIYYPVDSNTSRKWFIKNGELHNKIVSAPLWRYAVKTLYDYHAPNRYFDDIKPKALRFNFIKNGTFAPGVRYPIQGSDRCGYNTFDTFGDFIVVKDSNSNKKVFHTLDFRKWREVRLVQGGLPQNERIWVYGRNDDIICFYGSPFYAVIDTNSARFRFAGYTLRR